VRAVTAIGPAAETDPHDHVVELMRRARSEAGPRPPRDTGAPSVVTLGVEIAGRVLTDAARRLGDARRLLMPTRKS